jgi:hypothetical protein
MGCACLRDCRSAEFSEPSERLALFEAVREWQGAMAARAARHVEVREIGLTDCRCQQRLHLCLMCDDKQTAPSATRKRRSDWRPRKVQARCASCWSLVGKHPS